VSNGIKSQTKPTSSVNNSKIATQVANNLGNLNLNSKKNTMGLPIKEKNTDKKK
jgi:hypothetical protein